jgi:hypothetical protein
MMMSYQKAQQSLAPIVDRLNGLIGPNGLLLIVSHFLRFQFSFKGGVGNNNNNNLDMKINDVRLHIDDGWNYFYKH